MSSTLTPNMNLIVPGVGTEGGPQYAKDINADLSLLDVHDHTAGSGVSITPAAININSALTFQDNFATNVAGVSLSAQNSTPAPGTVYQSAAGYLYYTDQTTGSAFQLTNSTGIVGTAGSISGLPSGTASASYVSGSSTFVWQSATSIAANMDFGSAIMRDLSPNSTFALTLSPPTLSSNYQLVLPSLPSTQKIMTLDNAGNMSAPYTVDGTTIAISSNVIGIPNGAIGTTQMAIGSVTSSILAATTCKLASQIFTSDGTFTAPANTTNVIVLGAGGGGGGGSGGGGGGGSQSGGGGGGGGGCSLKVAYAGVTALANYAISIGTGGNGGTAASSGNNGNSGNNGTATTFGSILTFAGGLGAAGGVIGTSGTGTGGAGGIGYNSQAADRTAGATGGNSALAGGTGDPTVYASGGPFGSGASNAGGGGGGGAGWGAGASGTDGKATGNSAAGGAGTLGSGGGGSGGASNGNTGAGGKGGNGVCIVIWTTP